MDEVSTRGSNPPRKGLVASIWRQFWSPSARFSFGALILFGIAAGVLGWGAFNWTLELTNTEAFCTTCHEMRNNPYAELQHTVHFKNRSGVRATCPDCHVPKQWIYKVMAKIEATTDLYHKAMGSVDTPEKFEAKRAVLAERVWKTMKETDSRACRNCHSLDSMDPHKQSPKSAVMQVAATSGATCIDCHKGIAHRLPKPD